MVPQGWILLLFVAGTVTALGPASAQASASVPALHQTSEESLTSAYDAVTRKQRSLDTNSREYYNDLHSFKYHGADPDRKLDRDRQGDWDMDEENGEIEFLPNETGQLETVGNGFQGLNNKFLERAVMDYLDAVPEQEEPVTSLFRERERSSSRKRGNGAERLSIDNEEALDGSPYGLGDMDDEEYLDAFQMLYNGYKNGRDNVNERPYENENQMSWAELFNKESRARGQSREIDDTEMKERNQDQSVLYLTPAERRNVNGRYPIGRDFKIYRNLAKRYPVSKRSPKPLPVKKQITDPKVAQDLGALFGTQSAHGLNHTHDHDHDHEHEREHEHDHQHDHDHQHNHDHGREHEHEYGHGEQAKHETSSEGPKVTPPPKGQKENMTKVGNSKTIEVRKKSVDWSQYFGIDRRKKKASFMAGQGTQNQDDEWMLQRYYENMAENLKPDEREYEKENAERKDQFDRMDVKSKNIMDLIIAEARNYPDTEDGIDLQKVKDKVIANMIAAYSLEKMRKASNALVNSLAARIEAAQRAAARNENNQTSNSRENDSIDSAAEKREGKYLTKEVEEGPDESKSCLELEAIEKECKTAVTLAEDVTQVLYHSCITLLTCKACKRDKSERDCLFIYGGKAGTACYSQNVMSTQACRNAAIILARLQPPAVASQCRISRDSCIRHHYTQ